VGTAPFRQAHVQARHHGTHPPGRHHREQQHPAPGLHPHRQAKGGSPGRGGAPVRASAHPAHPHDHGLHRGGAHAPRVRDGGGIGAHEPPRYRGRLRPPGGDLPHHGLHSRDLRAHGRPEGHGGEVRAVFLVRGLRSRYEEAGSMPSFVRYGPHAGSTEIPSFVILRRFEPSAFMV